MGDPKAVEEGVRMFSSSLPGHISNDPLRNYKYLFVASVTLASRSAIAGGMDAERAYNISDLYILKMDTFQSVDEVKSLHADMFAFYTKEMAAQTRRRSTQIRSFYVSTIFTIIFMKRFGSRNWQRRWG